MATRRALSRALIPAMLILLFRPVGAGSQTAGAGNGGALAPVVRAAFATGFGRPLSGTLCTALGLTSKGQELPAEQLSAGAGDTRRNFSVSRHRGKLDIVISRRTPSDLIVFLLTSEGSLAKTIRVREGTPVENMSLEAAAPEFDKEKMWWLDTWLRQHSPPPAGNRPAK